MNKMMKAGGAFNFPIFKRKKKNKNKNKVSSSISPKNITTSKGNNNIGGGGKGIGIGIGITTTSMSSSSHSSSFGISRCTTSTSSNNYHGNDDWFVFEILTRLPVKSLFRFKSVSKNWSSLIQKDQLLMDLHFTRSKTRLPPRILIVLPLPPTTTDEEEMRKLRNLSGRLLYSRNKKKLHITADLVVEEEQVVVYNNNNGGGDLPSTVPAANKLELVVDTVREINKPSYHTISKPINGLICLINNYTKPVALICNICTGELSPPFPLNYDVHKSFYGLGFDPSTREYKLVCVCWDDKIPDYDDKFCEVLTIGRLGTKNNNTWRRIKEGPKIYPTDDYVYVNGVIYWYPPDWEGQGGYRPVIFEAFDVGSEKFRMVRIPHFIIRHVQIPNDNFKDDDIGKLFEVNGNLAMVVRQNNQTFKMYIYRDDVSGYTMEKKGRWMERKGRWSEVSTITLPFQMGKNHRVKFHTCVGSDDKIFITSSILHTEEKKCVSVYCFNWKKFSLTEVEVSGIPPSVSQLCPKSFFTTFSESLLSIDSQCSPARP